jgi:hypothetical protein
MRTQRWNSPGGFQTVNAQAITRQDHGLPDADIFRQGLFEVYDGIHGMHAIANG